MSETTSTTSAAVRAAAAKSAAVKATDNLNTVLPTVVETTDAVLELPTKVVVNQRLVFLVGVVGGVALGAGAVYAVNKIMAARTAKKVRDAAEAAVVEITKK
jgi:hypothetical protein